MNASFQKNCPTSPRRLRSLNRRQRKKMRLAEFQELGFEVRAAFNQPFEFNEGLYDQFIGAFIDLVESRHLVIGGMGGAFPLSKTDAFVTTAKRGSTTDEDRQAVLNWLLARSEVARAEVDDFVDACYGWD